jgi:hypothetical protein
MQTYDDSTNAYLFDCGPTGTVGGITDGSVVVVSGGGATLFVAGAHDYDYQESNELRVSNSYDPIFNGTNSSNDYSSHRNPQRDERPA